MGLPEASVTTVGLPSRTLALPATTVSSPQPRPPSCDARLTMCTADASRQLPLRACPARNVRHADMERKLGIVAKSRMAAA